MNGLYLQLSKWSRIYLLYIDEHVLFTLPIVNAFIWCAKFNQINPNRKNYRISTSTLWLGHANLIHNNKVQLFILEMSKYTIRLFQYA